MVVRRGDLSPMSASLKKVADLDSRVHMNTYARKNVLFVRGEGMRLFDDTNKAYLDFMSGIGTVNLGHSHPEVIEAVSAQVRKLTHVSNLYHVEHRAELAERLVDLFGGGAKVFLCNSGAEAVEGAIKLARKWATANKRLDSRTIVAAHRSFHGRTLTTLAATGQPSKQELFTPVSPGFKHVDLNDISALEEAIDDSVCAVLLEPVQGEGGVFPCSPEYLVAVRGICDRREVLLIFDEVQCGMYRTGPVFAHHSAQVRPDIMALAKALGNGLPIGAVVAKTAVADCFVPGDHGSTFGGGPVICAAACATLDALSDEGLGHNSLLMGDYLQQGLIDLAGESEWISAVRGAGLMVAMDVKSPIAVEIVADALAKGLVLNNTSPNTLRFLPPLCCTHDEIDILLHYMRDALAERGD